MAFSFLLLLVVSKKALPFLPSVRALISPAAFSICVSHFVLCVFSPLTFSSNPNSLEHQELQYVDQRQHCFAVGDRGRHALHLLSDGQAADAKKEKPVRSLWLCCAVLSASLYISLFGFLFWLTILFSLQLCWRPR
jgi:hypothetical protein